MGDLTPITGNSYRSSNNNNNNNNNNYFLLLTLRSISSLRVVSASKASVLSFRACSSCSALSLASDASFLSLINIHISVLDSIEELHVLMAYNDRILYKFINFCFVESLTASFSQVFSLYFR